MAAEKHKQRRHLE